MQFPESPTPTRDVNRRICGCSASKLEQERMVGDLKTGTRCVRWCREDLPVVRVQPASSDFQRAEENGANDLRTLAWSFHGCDALSHLAHEFCTEAGTGFASCYRASFRVDEL